MSTQHSSRSAIIISTIKGKIASILGYFLVIILGLPLVMNTYPDGGVIPFVLVMMGLGVLLIVYGIRTKRSLKRFKKYINIITAENNTSLENIAGQTSQSTDFVMKDMQMMINKKYFIDAYIDEKANEIVLKKRDHIVTNVQVENNTSVEMISVTCKGCGATNSIQKSIGSECEFCGSALGA